MGFAHGSSQAIDRLGRHDQMDVIRHHAISPHLDLRLPRLLGEQISIDLVVAIFEANIASR
jgi:hypothetical protein